MSSPSSCPDVRVVIVAEHASARLGGEPILPLQYFRLLRKRGVEAWLVVHERTRGEIEQVLAEDRERVHFVADRWIQKACWQVSRCLPNRLAMATFGFAVHLVTQIDERRLVRSLVKRVGATVVHEPIPVSPRTPSMMFDVGAPVVIGPMNGGMTFPAGLRHVESWFERACIGMGRRLSGAANAIIPGKRRAALLLVANQRTRDALPEGACPRVIELVENAVDLAVFRPGGRGSPRPSRVRFAYVGRLVDWKAVDLLIDAFAKVASTLDAELRILGDGPERSSLEAHARTRGVSERVHFEGWVPQEKLGQALAEADIMVLPSLYECGGAVVLEGMAMGLPVIATRWGGPVDYIDDSTGILVEPTDRSSFVLGLEKAMRRMAEDPALRSRLGEAARLRVLKEFDWERKIDRIIEIYREGRSVGAESTAGA